MKEKFLFYYEEPDFNKLWTECTFIFDTNVLLNLYRYPKETSEDLIRKLEHDISNQLWLPHQVALEYQEGRYGVIKDQKKFYRILKGKIKEANNLFNQKINSEGLFEQDHYYLNPNKLGNDIKKEIGSICAKYLEKINEKKSNHHDFLMDDIIRDKIDKLFNGDKLGEKISDEELLEIIEKGKVRYALKIGPGHGDNKKSTPEKFGDLIIWYQIIEYSKKNDKSIIFVTEDKSKEDWLIDIEGDIVPRKSLVQEFYDKTDGHEIYIYDFKQFTVKSEEYLGIKYSDKTKDDVKKLENYLKIDNILKESVNSSNIHSLEYKSYSNTLEVVFHSGGVYQYYNVPEFRFTGIMSADSKGSYFDQHIKGKYRYKKLG
jgi:hypothetical protein